MNRILSISLFLALGQALGQAEEDGKLVATEYSPFGSVGSMVGIHVDHQNRVHVTHTYRRNNGALDIRRHTCLLYTSPSPRDRQKSRMPSSA